MKSKSFNKKINKQLILNKETIATLRKSAMDNVLGGYDYTQYTYCASCLAHPCEKHLFEPC